MSEPTDGTNATIPMSDSINNNNNNNNNNNKKTIRFESMNQPETQGAIPMMLPGPDVVVQPQPSIPSFPFPVAQCGSNIIGPYSLIVSDPSNKVKVRKRINRPNTINRYPRAVIRTKVTTSSSSSTPSVTHPTTTTTTTTNNNNKNNDNNEPITNEDEDRDWDDNHVDVFSNDNKDDDDDDDEKDNDEEKNESNESNETNEETTKKGCTRRPRRIRPKTTTRQYSTRSQAKRPIRRASAVNNQGPSTIKVRHQRHRNV
jgi:hypothetical protein